MHITLIQPVKVFGADQFDVNICHFGELAETKDVVFFLGSGLHLVFTETRTEDLDQFS